MGRDLLGYLVLGGSSTMSPRQKFLGSTDYIAGTPDLESMGWNDGEDQQKKFHCNFNVLNEFEVKIID